MEDPQLGWNNSGDVLQGIMVSHDGSHPSSDLSDFRPSSLALSDSASNPLLELHLSTDLASLEARNPPPFLGQWPSTDTQDFYYAHYPPSRLTADQDAWNPLQVTGVPNPSSVSHMNVSAVGDPDCGFSKPHYGTPSDSGSQYMGSYSADSGYGSTSCASHSVVTSSHGMDSMSSPQIGAIEHNFEESVALFDQSRFSNGQPFAQGTVASSPHFLDSTVKCDHPTCNWVGKCPSDKRKHEARHRKLFKCDEPNCPRKEGFGTINDLARHKKCVHNKEPERGPKMMYLCFGRNCPRPNKKWPRLDNFKQHLSRMHHEEDADALLQKSMDWYEGIMGRRASRKLDDTSSPEDSSVEAPQDMASVQSIQMDLDSEHATHNLDGVDILSSRAPTPQPSQHSPQNESILDDQSPQFPAFGSPGFASSFAKDSHALTEEAGILKSGTFVTDAADNLLHAMTKMMNHRGRMASQHSDKGIEIEWDNSQLSPPQRHVMQKVLSVALERLSDEVSATLEPCDDKRDWFQCNVCSKRTRLRCEMKKHQKRHERPYGCTFPNCAKSFGSKADWKRHESSQHLHIPSWLCALQDSQTGASCGRIFYREETYTQHLGQHHGLFNNGLINTLNSSRLDIADQSGFWCGFCSRTIPLRNHGPAALDERFNHIDIEHFKKSERGRDWRFPSLAEREVLHGGGYSSVNQHEASPSPIDDGNHRKRKFGG
ncbi:uncharacterized protein N7459_006790 [Penicillium hispanicum]|uniref:uncharacterized protein n=1 Tax=Penicillium hispanicum TaxID=1080232 RepID=UPI002540DAD2|nr:uncharacterized protein N7459_006790 [Penicillium hispanicum]KAJ5577826.1 hypothetical protein N7459_006790 [Penicillium hispanicum]